MLDTSTIKEKRKEQQAMYAFQSILAVVGTEAAINAWEDCQAQVAMAEQVLEPGSTTLGVLRMQRDMCWGEVVRQLEARGYTNTRE